MSRLNLNKKKSLIQKYFNQASKLSIKNIKYKGQLEALTKFFLNEDLDGRGDITTNLLIKKNNKVEANIVVKEQGVVAGVEEVVWFLRNNKIKTEIKIKDGQKVKKGDLILKLTGGIKDILKTERTVLNLLQRMSGIATQTRKLIDIIGSKVLICPTRKTQWGLLDKKAVVLGGGGTHRLGLYDFVLIKDNHLTNNQLTNKLINQLSNTFWEVEVESINQALQIAKLSPSAIMFDNFEPDNIKKAIIKIKKINPNIIFESSGGINENNIKKYANTGVDIISLGALTHSTKALDIGLGL